MFDTIYASVLIGIPILVGFGYGWIIWTERDWGKAPKEDNDE